MQRLFIVFFIILSIIATAVVINTQVNKTKETKKEKVLIHTGTTTVEEVQETPKTEKELSEEAVRKKIETLRKRFAVKGLIVSGDIHLKNDEYVHALKKYLEAYNKNKNDPVILNKIGDTYFLMKNYERAKEYYEKIDGEDIQGNENYLLTLFYTLPLASEEDRNILLEKIGLIYPEGEDTRYYTFLLEALSDFHTAKLELSAYFDTQEYTGENEKLQRINQAIEAYRNFQIDEVYYKNALIIGALYENQSYRTAILLGQELLEEKPNYQPILKIIAQSYFEMGDYENAKKILMEFNKIDQENADTNYMLGVINLKLKEYVLSNIYLVKALEIGYSEKQELYRRLIYNYYILGDMEKVLVYFEKLLHETEVPDSDDLILAIYYQIMYGDLEVAKEWTVLGLNHYDTIADFYGFKGWILKEEESYEEATKQLQKGFDLNSKNPMINLNLGQLEMLRGQTVKARIYFRKVVQEAVDTEFATIAEQELERLDSKK